MLSKHHQLPFPGKIPKPSCPLEVVHSDLSSCITPPSINGYRYYFKLTDGFSKDKHVYFLKYKSETFKFFLEFKSLLEKQSGHQIKRLVNDNGGEYLDGEFQKYLKSEGIVMDTTASYTPQQNPISERGNRTTTERARCILINAKLPKKFWAEAVATAVYIENRSPEASLKLQTPHELWFGTKADLSHLRIFGCSAYRLIPKQFRGLKFATTSEKMILLGYQDRLHNYRLLNPAKNKVIYSHDVIFDESDFEHPNTLINFTSNRPDILHKAPPEDTTIQMDRSNLSEETDGDAVKDSPSTSPDAAPSASPNTNIPITPRQPETTSTSQQHDPISGTKRKVWTDDPSPPSPSKEISSSIDSQNIIKGRRRRHANAAVLPSTSPRTYKQAMASPDRTLWEKAIEVELENMRRHDVFTVTELPQGAKAIGTTWVFKEKWSTGGSYIKHKATMCAQGFTQVEGVD